MKAIIFDVDDTMYDIATGFTDNRNGITIQNFMVEQLNFPDRLTAKTLRDEYFAKYHSSMKALTVANQEGKLIYGKDFKPEMLNDWFATKCDFSLIGPNPKFIKSLSKLKSENIKLIAFSNGPRKYVLKMLDVLGVKDLFPDDSVFAVDDTLPYCKPEPEAFQKVLDRICANFSEQVNFEDCVMVEDSMKNIRASKELGMKTVLITGTDVNAHHAIDRPTVSDPAIDVVCKDAGEMEDLIPGLWKVPAVFELA
eukprot:CAMPEP_0196814130 /NCGR_PEP_ID=MMETSP1362-20130617/41468_1 /TAXON_ID=163516 /ORGANISM="Leptocylindrus danicus, Strain CCMP1856" /LENGTH=252 /DNA_ID=CAMNT_0042190645 /DNA_START=46 /DNA_END=804 /DNA_ORIENTATION=-